MIKSAGSNCCRWWIYQRERFPIVGHGLLILCFSFCALSFSAQLRGSSLPALPVFLVAFVSCFFSFLHLRIADEFKDYEEDSAFRPYRPVPRGLVTLQELGVLWALTAIIQLLLALWLNAWLVVVLLMTWFYLALMSHEFFARKWLKAHPITYMWTHMLIMPLIDFYATACDWVPSGEGIPSGLFMFVVVSFFNGMVIEIGRKIRAPEDEEAGVETYSALWGRKHAVWVWLAMMGITAISGIVAATLIAYVWVPLSIFAIQLLIAAWVGFRFLKDPVSKHSSGFEKMSGIWTLVLYSSLGIFPLFQ